MNIKIPKQLLNDRFIKTNEKRPIEPSWNLDKSLYEYDSKEKIWINKLTTQVYINTKTKQPYKGDILNNYSAKEIKTFKNLTTYGVLCGYNGLFVVDCDCKNIETELLKIPIFHETFTVRTAKSKLCHFYFFDNGTKHPNTVRINDSKGKRLADIQGVGTQVIGAYSTLKDGSQYIPINNNPIKIVSFDVIMGYIKRAKPNVEYDVIESNRIKKEGFDEIDPLLKEIKEKVTIKVLLEHIGIDTRQNPCESPLTSESVNKKSFSYTDGIFHDFHTEKSGSVFQLYMEYYDVDFSQAKDELMKLGGIVDKKIKKATDYLDDNYIFFYAPNATEQKRYILYDKKAKHSSDNSFSGIVQNVIASTPNNIDIFDILNIPTKGKKDKILKPNERKILYRIYMDDYIDKNLIEIKGGYGYRPVNDVVYSDDNGHKCFNKYTSIPLHSQPLVSDSTKECFPNIYQIIKHITVTDELYNFFCDWLGFILQNPLEKLPTSFIFMGVQGTGKSKTKHFILDCLFGVKNSTEITQHTLTKGWGDAFQNKRIIFADEINLHSKQFEYQCDVLKNYTTNSRIMIDIKGQDSREIENYSHWIFTSNKRLPFRIDMNDRRYTVIEQKKPINDKFIANIDPKTKNNVHKKEIASFYSHLMKRRITFNSVSKPIHTDIKKEVIFQSLPNGEKFIESIRSYDTFREFLDGEELGIVVTQDCVGVRDFYLMFGEWCNINGYKVGSINSFGGDVRSKINMTDKTPIKRFPNLSKPKKVYPLNLILGRDVVDADMPSGNVINKIDIDKKTDVGEKE